MKKIYFIATIVTLTSLFFCGYSLAKSSATLPLIKTIDAIQAVPGNGVQMVESAGRIFFVTPTGKFNIYNTVHDIY